MGFNSGFKGLIAERQKWKRHMSSSNPANTCRLRYSYVISVVLLPQRIVFLQSLSKNRVY